MSEELEYYKVRDSSHIKIIKAMAEQIEKLEKELAFMEGEYPEPTIAAKIKEFANLEQALRRIAELEKDLHMVQRHYDQLNLPDGYVVVCVHCAKELKIDFDEPDDLEAKVKKYEEVLHAIANEQIELSHDKIKWQCEDHIRWAREALSSPGNNAQDVGNTEETLLKGKQTKPLSDEEIIKIRQATKATTAENWADTLAFARAIEERHGVK